MDNIKNMAQNGVALFALLMAIDGHDPFANPSEDTVSEGGWEWQYVIEADAIAKNFANPSLPRAEWMLQGLQAARPGLSRWVTPINFAEEEIRADYLTLADLPF